MATTATTPATHTESMTVTSNEPPSSPRGRGRGRGRGNRDNRGGRGRGRGQGQIHDLRNGPGPNQTSTIADSSFGRPPGGSSGARLTGAAQIIQGDSQALSTGTDKGKEVAEDQEVCFICASPIDHVSIAPCNHQTCHICALRLRALYKTRACAHCRVSFTPIPFLLR
jgi:E3 ubiquitin-protein ligase ZNF598